MTSVSKLFSSFTDKKSSFVTHLIERVSGKTLTGYKLNLAHAIGMGFLFGFLFSLLDAALLLLQFGLPHLGGIAANAVFTFSVCFSFAFLVTLLLNFTSDWEDNLKNQNKHYRKFISFIFRLITLPLILLILWLYFSSLPFSRYDDKIRAQELISICEECTPKAVNSADISNTVQRGQVLTLTIELPIRCNKQRRLVKQRQTLLLGEYPHQHSTAA